MSTTKQESRVRSLAQRRGYRVHRSRQWKHVPHLDNFGDLYADR
jgi:hypothetical protein